MEFNIEEFKNIMNYVIDTSKGLIKIVENSQLDVIYEFLVDIETEIFRQRIKITRALNKVK